MRVFFLLKHDLKLAPDTDPVIVPQEVFFNYLSWSLVVTVHVKFEAAGAGAPAEQMTSYRQLDH